MTLGPFQQYVDQALGVIGASLGVPHAAYRLTLNSSGDFPDGWYALSSSVPVLRNRVTSRNLESALLSERTLWYELAGNMSPFSLGDVFIAAPGQDYQAGAPYGAGATWMPGTAALDGFALAWHAPTQPPIGGRIDRRVGIYRPDLAPELMPDGSRRWAVTHEEDTPLVLENGTYRWGNPGDTASWVPCGFGSNDREYRQGAFQPDTIGITPSQRYYAYIPILPGWQPTEGDAIITENDERYVVVAPYEQTSGVVGYQLMLQRLNSGV